MGMCCRSLKDAKVLMKMGLGLVLVGHVNFLLGALVHGCVLRDVKVASRSSTIEYAISNIIALVAGLVGVISGITTVMLSKNMKKQPLKWLLLVVSVVTCILGAASAISIFVSFVTAIYNNGSNLLKQCRRNTTVNLNSVTYECPFDPTRIYGTTLILWGLLVFMSVIEVVFSARCFAASTSFLRLPCPWRKTPRISRVRIRAPRNVSPDRVPSQEYPAERHDLLNPAPPTEENSWV